jgi:endonuclease/exonuclease/phosphatase family metal-dependent hydrolase
MSLRSGHVRRGVRRRLAGIGAAAAVVGMILTLPAGPALAGQDSPPGAAHAAAPARTFDVMTRNLYLGADLTPVITALASGNQTAIVTAATQTWAAVQATKPEERMAAIADEIVAERPAVVGLQEVTRWTTYSSYNPATGQAGGAQVRYDFLELLLKALADRGVVYHEVEGATAENFASPPIPILTSTGLGAVSLTDRDVILRRSNVKTTNAHTGQYQNVLTFPLPPEGAAGDLPVKRGWGSTDVRTKLATFRFVNSHLEAFGIPGFPAEGLRVLQVQELLAAQAGITAQHGALPTVYVGDYNSEAPSAPAYSLLAGSVGHDAWLETNPGDPGYTCCFNADLRGGTLDSRIDLVLHTHGITANSAEIIGDEVGDKTASGLYPSDHAGVVASLTVG